MIILDHPSSLILIRGGGVLSVPSTFAKHGVLARYLGRDIYDRENSRLKLMERPRYHLLVLPASKCLYSDLHATLILI